MTIGLLPAIEVNGRVITESQVIMELLDQLYPASQGFRPMVPDRDDNPEAFARYQRLAKLERDLFRWWCTLVFYPEDNDNDSSTGGGNPFSRLLGGGGGKVSDNDEMSTAMKGFMDCIRQVDRYLTSTKGPWFFEEYDYPTMIDFVYVSHVERMLASCAYWKGLNVRDPKWQLKGLNAWIDAFEKREPYLAFKSDYYTHVMDIPPQYGPGYDGGFEQDRIKLSNSISGKDGTSWHLPLSHDDPLQPLYRGPPLPLAVLEAAGIRADKDGSYKSCNADVMARACRLYAAYKLSHNGVNVARFAARGGPSGAKNMRKTFQAPLADPYAEPDANLQPTVDAVLRVICNALLDVENSKNGGLPSDSLQEQLLAAIPEKKQVPGVVSSLAYLRDRVGVPRDMPLAAARYLRAYLNWGIDTLKK
jgi:glutathione S-transferase